ncbi:MAG: hypothetical protein ACXADH_10835, partial [Candidatus Kariarchaeaceae archaeon]
ETVLKLAQDRYDQETKTLAELEDELEQFKKDTHEALSWWRKQWSDPDSDINDYYWWTHVSKTKWPVTWQRRALGLIAMTKKAEGNTVALSPDDAKFLGLERD